MICQLHILLSRTAQISLELHFDAEMHTKKPSNRLDNVHTVLYGALKSPRERQIDGRTDGRARPVFRPILGRSLITNTKDRLRLQWTSCWLLVKR